VLKELVKALHPITLSELEYKILSIDKSNIFRALTLFKEHHLVHVIEGGSEGVRYELCHSHDNDHDEDIHPHFYCEECQQTFCLDYTEIPNVKLPKGFEQKSANLMIKGICPDCKNK
jgi:Fur family ferric uptake transcriptional regulator